ncbi:MAG: peptidoglycan editing factor PgeF [Burkholderiales bacterium]|uniref:peptidoglycan editing factor PgeF n=1 Tax=uncultured Turicimonas sp. TaxID=1918607 RepID=UPI001EB9B88F|nr:peptidoglycan editing factor PgeF [uncultured Turicimonas sp.]MBS4846528.1 peptidoglycan editing factor PgeF [Burkholderiales bacterium]
MSNFQKPSIELIEPNWPAPDNVKAFFTSRNGGVSAGAYGGADGFNGLNLGKHVGDSPYCVRKNREIVESLGCKDLRFLNQVHSSRVLEADEIVSDAEDADASFTTKPNIGCVVMTADCLPILLCSKDGEIVCACHAGWKGLAAGVIQESVKKMKEKLSSPSIEIMAWIGPCLDAENFVVQQDVKDIFLKSELAPFADKYFIPDQKGFLLNFSGLASETLKLAGVNEVYDSGLSTYGDPDRFYSYRRDKVTGRHGAVIYKQ